MLNYSAVNYLNFNKNSSAISRNKVRENVLSSVIKLLISVSFYSLNVQAFKERPEVCQRSCSGVTGLFFRMPQKSI